MNDWQYQEVGPLHNKRFFHNETKFWVDTDTEELFNQHIKQDHTHTLLKNHGWLDKSIEYKFNYQGFRDIDFDDRPCVLALGCSLTQGTGLTRDSIWPQLVSNEIGLHAWNLGSAGCSIQTVFRILDYYLNKLNPRAVFVLVPFKARLEWCDIDGVYKRILPNSFDENNKFMRDWIAQEKNHNHNDRVHRLAIEKLCLDANVPVYMQPSEQVINDSGLARDLQHPGPGFQKAIAQNFLELFNDV